MAEIMKESGMSKAELTQKIREAHFNCGASFYDYKVFRMWEMTDEQMNRWLVSDLGVMADPGHEYGPGGENHIRLNLATPSERIREFTKRLIGRKGTGKTI